MIRLDLPLLLPNWVDAVSAVVAASSFSEAAVVRLRIPGRKRDEEIPDGFTILAQPVRISEREAAGAGMPVNLLTGSSNAGFIQLDIEPGRNCRRRVCFFAHTPEQLRLLPGASVGSRNGFQSKSHEGSNLRHAVSFDGPLSVAGYDGGGSSPVNHFGNGGGYFDGPQTGGSSPRGYLCSKSNLSCTSQFQISSPTSTLVGHAHSPPPLSPPLSPSGSPRDSSANWTYGVSNSSPVGAANKPLHHKSFNFVNMDTSSVSASPVVHPSYSLQSPCRHNSISIPPSHDSRGLSSPVSSLSNDGSSQSPSNGVSDLISSLQSLDLNGAGSSSATAPSGPSQWLQSHASYAAMHSNCSPRDSNL